MPLIRQTYIAKYLFVTSDYIDCRPWCVGRIVKGSLANGTLTEGHE